MKIINQKTWESLSSQPREINKKKLSVVRKILKDVRKEGDVALCNYAEKLDQLKSADLEVSSLEIEAAYQEIDKETLNALKKAVENIKEFAQKQKSLFKEFTNEKDGITLGQKIIPLERVGCYVPGGLYPLPSSALMSVIPAKVAGVREIIVCSPNIQPVTIVAANLAGADKIFRIGGAQAIAALAYGTQTIPQVNKIVGPGNNYVNLAKKEVYGGVGIDFIAGPSEILIIADKAANPQFIAADLLAQAEHSPAAKVNLITTSRKMTIQVNNELKNQLGKLPTRKIAEIALKKGRIILVNTLAKAADISNKIAPEHLELQIRNPDRIIKRLRNYGSLFIGEYSAEVFGDYCSGVNHILPTDGAARYSGGLSVKDFLKIVTYQRVSLEGARKIAKTATKLGEIEGLVAHRKSAQFRG